MLTDWFILLASLAYIGILFAVASWGDRLAIRRAGRSRAKPLVYALSLAVYCTSWTFYGSVGLAAKTGYDFIPVYLGPILLFTAGFFVLRKVVRIGKAENITTIADFIAARFGKSHLLGAIVTLVVVIGILPYIALQLKAVSTSFNVLVNYPGLEAAVDAAATVPWWGDTALVVALLMAMFSIVFGTRNIDATEHHEGMMLAIAFESVVKLVAFLAVGIFATFYMFGGVDDLLSRARASDLVGARFGSVDVSGWTTIIVLSLTAIICLPRQFHVAVVENADESELRKAAWLFPSYLVAINIFVIPVAVAGLLAFGASNIDADTFVLALPLVAQQDALTLLVFIGGLSAATGMVIVATVALSTMVSNDVFMPLYLHYGGHGGRGDADVGRRLLIVRRVTMTVLLLLAFAYYRGADERQALASIGLISFAGVAQFAPAIFLGIFWTRANHAGALAGIVGGSLVWAYTLLLPSIDGSLWLPDILARLWPGVGVWLQPQMLFGIDLGDPLTHGVVWSLGVNLALLVGLSLATRPSAIERGQARAFVDVMADERETRSRTVRGSLVVGDLEDLATRYLGAETASRAFAEFRAERVPPLAPQDPVDAGVLRYTERLLASAIGASSARLVLAMSLDRADIDIRSAMSLLDDATAAIRFNRELLQSTMENLRQGIAVFDENLRLAWLNERFRSYLGLPELYGRNGLSVEDIIRYSAEHGEYGPGDVETIVAGLLAQYRQREPATYERRLADGTVLEVRTSPMPNGGVAVTLSDVTERVRAAAALEESRTELEHRVEERTRALTDLNDQLRRATEAAQQANLGKTRFLAAASHDLLQPLNAARLFLSSLIERGHDADDSALLGRLDTSLGSVEDLLTELLDISKLDAGGVQPKIEDFAIRDLLEALDTEFAALAAARHVSLTVVGSSCFVRSDRRLLRRVLQNLLSNAIRYTPAGGRVLLGCRRAGGRLRIEVLDTGPGIPEDMRETIFQEFQRIERLSAPGEEARDEKGLGLGLAIVDRIARMLGLPVGLRSVPGRGSAFAVTVPLGEVVRAGAEIASMPDLHSRELEDAVVLCLDDNPDVRDGMHRLLSGWGCDVRLASGAQDWRVALAETPPDLILADYHLGPEIKGIDVIAEVCSVFERVIPAILITAEPSELLREEAARRGHAIQPKPVRPAALRALMTRMMAQRAAVGQRGG